MEHSTGDEPLASSRSPAARAIATILRPLARLMIDHGIGLGAVVDLLKQSLVQESEHRYQIAGRTLSDTRVALLTGVHRKDVRKLRSASKDLRHDQVAIPLTSAVVARWLSDPLFLHLDQSPRYLHRSPKTGEPGQPGFPDLVASVSKDVSARAVLDELVRLGAVTVSEQGQVELVDKAFVPHGSLSDQFEFLAGSVSDHLDVAAHNLTPQRETPALLEQSAFSNNLSAEQAELLHVRARQLWSVALQKFLQAASIAEARSLNTPGPRQRVRWGVYFMKQDDHGSALTRDQKPQ